MENEELKAGHPPAQKVGGMRVVQHKQRTASSSEADKDGKDKDDKDSSSNSEDKEEFGEDKPQKPASVSNRVDCLVSSTTIVGEERRLI